MGHWNYRVTYDDDVLPHYEVREVYYDDDGAVAGWTEQPMAPFGENLDELRDDLAKMQEALNRPVLDITDQDNPYEVTDVPE